jgi:hypothetical protein
MDTVNDFIAGFFGRVVYHEAYEARLNAQNGVDSKNSDV